MGVVNRYWKRVVRSPDDELGKWWEILEWHDSLTIAKVRFLWRISKRRKEISRRYGRGLSWLHHWLVPNSNTWNIKKNSWGIKGIILIQQTMKTIFLQTLSYIHVEDVWVTGLLRERLNISLIDARWMRGWTSLQNLLMIKTMQNTKTYIRDYINAMPIERNITSYKVEGN